MEFSQDSKNKLEKLRGKYPTTEALLLPALYIAQREFGYIYPEVELCVAAYLNLPATQVHAVSTFYTMYNKKPVGRYHVQVCTNIACSLLGADHLADYISKKLGVERGEMTSDGKFTLTEVECLGSCGTAPMMQINDDYYENLTEKKVDEILDGLK